jgi:simple sugar transport system ATP-binding protein
LPILELNAVSKHFGAIHALNEVDMTLDEGEVLGLMGDNGAGKSTLVKVIAGNFPPTHGEIRLSGEPVHKPVEARVREELGTRTWFAQSVGRGECLPRAQARGAGPFRWLERAMAKRAGECSVSQVRDQAPRPVRRCSAGVRRHRCTRPVEGPAF